MPVNLAVVPLLRRYLPLAAVAVTAASCHGPGSNPSHAHDGTHSLRTHGDGALSNAPIVNLPAHPLPPGQTARVGGDLTAEATYVKGDYRSGPSRIDTPLPEGYPPPTPPGAIDIKTYPLVRMAEVSGKGSPDSGMNRAFWPLFNHIKSHGIAMTSPVEMNFDDLDERPAKSSEQWSMAFLYRTPDMHTTGVEGDITVRDAQPVTVLAVGLRGDYSMSLVERGMRQIEDWLAANPTWVADGSWRTLYYNGPSLLFWNKWAEVQLPVRPADAKPVAPETDGV